MHCPKISLIIPFYNVEQYARQLVDSIKAQSFIDFEALIVNDGSKDDGAKIIEELIVGDNRFKLLNKPNGGASSARNFGLDNACGEWIAFMDADDVIGPEYLSELYKSSEYGDIVVAGFYEEQNGHLSVSVDFTEGKYIRQVRIVEDVINDHNLFHHPSPIAKLYKASIVQSNKVRFNCAINFAEDLLFWFDCLCETNSVVIIPPIDYTYLKDNSLLTKQKHRFNSDFELSCGVKNSLDRFVSLRGVSLSKKLNGLVSILPVNALAALKNENYSIGERHKCVMMVWKEHSQMVRVYYKAPSFFMKIKKAVFIYMPWLYSVANL